jgi:tRNA(Ile)-lysidine synthase
MDALEQDVRIRLLKQGVGPASRMLVAISGGVDSVVLVYILKKLGYRLQLAHINYHLRGHESNRDEDFVRKIAAEWQLPIQCFDRPISPSERKGRSIQEVTREIRYSWFAGLLENFKLDYLATAHHADDQAETILMQMGRSAGIQGLGGMAFLSGNHLRPLLYVERQKIEAYAEKNNIRWVDDSSNAGDYYLRNRFRHYIVPALRELLPGFVTAMGNSADHLREARYWLEKAWMPQLEKLVKPQPGGWLIQLEAPLNEADSATLWQLLLHKLELPGNLLQGCMNLQHKQVGKLFETAHWRIVREKSALRISLLDERDLNSFVEINSPGNYSFRYGLLEITEVEKMQLPPERACIYADADTLSLPLLLRDWQAGDELLPYGLQGHKKLSDLYTDAHISREERKKFPVLCTPEEILWLVGVRRAQTAMVTANTRKIWKIRWTN